jgi:hypothetical protein
VDARLIPVNAFIALSSPRATSWPNPLFEIGYRMEGLEVPATAASSRVVIDCVAFDPSSNRFLLGEGKSGYNIEPGQAQRYGRVDPQDLVRLIGVTITTRGEQTAEPLYVCVAEATERILLGLSEAGCAYPVLAVSATELSLHGKPPSDSALADAFSRPVVVSGPPPAVILVDDQSDDSEFDGIVSAALVAEMARGHELIGCPDLAARAIPHLHLFATGYRNLLVRAVSRAAQRLCGAASDNFEYRGPTQTRSYAVVKVLDSPERSDPRGRTQRYQALKARMTGTTVAEHAQARQEALFDEIDLAAELEKADTDEIDVEQPREEGQ